MVSSYVRSEEFSKKFPIFRGHWILSLLLVHGILSLCFMFVQADYFTEDELMSNPVVAEFVRSRSGTPETIPMSFPEDEKPLSTGGDECITPKSKAPAPSAPVFDDASPIIPSPSMRAPRKAPRKRKSLARMSYMSGSGKVSPTKSLATTEPASSEATSIIDVSIKKSISGMDPKDAQTMMKYVAGLSSYLVLTGKLLKYQHPLNRNTYIVFGDRNSFLKAVPIIMELPTAKSLGPMVLIECNLHWSIIDRHLDRKKLVNAMKSPSMPPAELFQNAFNDDEYDTETTVTGDHGLTGSKFWTFFCYCGSFVL